MKIILIIILFGKIWAQACCTAGTPILGTLDLSSSQIGELQLGLTYEYNSITDVVEGTNTRESSERERFSQSLLFEVNYGITERIGLTGMFSYLRQKRITTPRGLASNEITTSGPGDAVLLIKYNIIPIDPVDQLNIAIGGGMKFSTGTSDLKDNGILLPADLQPSTGSNDFIFWGLFAKTFLGENPVSVYANLSYRVNTENKRFGNDRQGYKFGNEFVLNAGGSYSPGAILDLTLLIRFRATGVDAFGGSDIANTGGDWLYLVPGVNFKFFDSFSLRLSGQLPVYRNLNGSQLSTSFTTSASVFYNTNLFSPL